MKKKILGEMMKDLKKFPLEHKEHGGMEQPGTHVHIAIGGKGGLESPEEIDKKIAPGNISNMENHEAMESPEEEALEEHTGVEAFGSPGNDKRKKEMAALFSKKSKY